MLRLQQPITPSDLVEARRLLQGLNPALRDLGVDWYPAVNERCQLWALQSGYTVEQCAAVLALYSINNRWQQNVNAARRALLEGHIVGLSHVVRHVRAILAGAPIAEHLTEGRKVQNFYRSILLLDSCTVDRWIFRIFDRPQGEEWYGWVERCVRLLADEEGLPAYTLQAILWLAVVADAGEDVARYHARLG
jgi:hypothetical protein